MVKSAALGTSLAAMREWLGILAIPNNMIKTSGGKITTLASHIPPSQLL